MSSRARLILLSGVGGAGTTTLCEATVAALESEGLAAAFVDATAPGDADTAVVARLTGSLGRLGGEIGADPMLADAWTSLPIVRDLSTLRRISAALSDPGIDAVVVDAGPLAAARDLVELPAAAIRLLDALLTPRIAMWRATGDGGSDTVFESLSALRLDVIGLLQMLHHPGTTLRLVSTPDEGAVRRTSRALAVFAMLGIGVDGVAVNRVPRKSEGAPKAIREQARQALDLMTELADGVPVWASTAKVRAVPKGRSALGPLGRVRVLDAEELTVTVGDEDFSMEVPLAGPARAEGRVGYHGDHLVVQFDGVMRWIDLPAVLRRCIPQEAVRTRRGLSVRFAPDPAAWRRPEVVR